MKLKKIHRNRLLNLDQKISNVVILGYDETYYRLKKNRWKGKFIYVDHGISPVKYYSYRYSFFQEAALLFYPGPVFKRKMEIINPNFKKGLLGGFTKSEFSHSNGDPDLNENTTHMNMFMGINFPEKYIKLFDFEFGFYWMKMTTGSGTMFGDKGTIWANMGVGKSFFDNQFKVSLKLNNLLDAGGFQMDETYDIYPSGETFPNGRDWGSQRTNMSHSGRPRTLSMNFTYSFGKLEDDKHKGRKHQHDDEGGGGMDIGF